MLHHARRISVCWEKNSTHMWWNAQHIPLVLQLLWPLSVFNIWMNTQIHTCWSCLEPWRRAGIAARTVRRWAHCRWQSQFCTFSHRHVLPRRPTTIKAEDSDHIREFSDPGSGIFFQEVWLGSDFTHKALKYFEHWPLIKKNNPYSPAMTTTWEMCFNHCFGSRFENEDSEK